MKTIFKCLFAAAVLLTFRMEAQISSCKTGQVQSGSSLFCLNNPFDYYPTTNDVDTIHVNFIFTKPASGFGQFDTLGRFGPRILVDFMNQNVLDSLHAPQLTVSPTPAYIKHPKIYIHLKNVTHVTNTLIYGNAYDTTGLYMNNPKGPRFGVIPADPKAINIVFACDSVYPFYGFGATSSIPGNEIIMIYAPATHYGPFIDPSNGAGIQAMLILHEIGHALGLVHPDTYIGNLNYAAARNMDDYFIEDTTIFGKWGACGTPNRSNNILAYNQNCRWYLSPKQIGLAHYYLNSGDNTHYSSRCLYNTSQNVNITSTQTWTLSKAVGGDLRIKAGNTLTVKCKVSIPKNGRVIVERNAKLIIDGGEITNFCGELWGGIEVMGSPTQDQSMNGTTQLANYQGLLVVKNGGTVSQSGNAVKNYTTDVTGNVDWNSVGGIIIGDGGNFIDNGRDVEFEAYAFNSASNFKNCTFAINDSLREAHIPFARVSMYDIQGVSFRGCNFTFNNSAYKTVINPGIGISSMDAIYTVDKICPGTASTCTTPSTFSNFTYGAYAMNSIPLRAPYFANSKFSNNLKDGANFINVKAFTMDNNTFLTGPNFSNAVYLNNCSYYMVKNNTFQEPGTLHQTTGMYVYNSFDGSHQVYRNNFAGFKAALLSASNNSGPTNFIDGLLMNCNDFTTGWNYYDISVLGGLTGLYMPTVMTKQGSIALGASSASLVRNKYGAICGNDSKWYTDPVSTKIVNHGSNTDAVTQPLPHTAPACSGTIINVVVSTHSLNYVSDCPSVVQSGGNGGSTSSVIMANLNSYISSVQSETSVNQFELKASVASKLNLFMSDSALANKDSVISTFSHNISGMSDADIMLIYAYIHKRDFASAVTRANALPAGRADWKALLLKLITIYQEPTRIYSINTNSSYKTFLQGYANTDGKDGQTIAQALLKFVCNIDYLEPRPLPVDGTGGRMAANGETTITTGLAPNSSSSKFIEIYPNPTQGGLTISCGGYEGAELLVEVKDLLGKVIFTKFISNPDKQNIFIGDYKNGVYMVSVSKNKEIIYTGKIIKQD